MPVTAILQNETSLAIVADRLFANLPPDSRKIAEASLLKLNPDLSSSNALRPGVIIKLPETSALNQKQINDDPFTQTTELLKGVVENFRNQLIEQVQTQTQDLLRQTTLIAEVEHEIVGLNVSENLKKSLNTLNISLGTRIKETNQPQPNLEGTFKQILFDLSK